MNAYEVVVREVQRDSRFQIGESFTECVGEPSKSSQLLPGQPSMPVPR